MLHIANLSKVHFLEQLITAADVRSVGDS